jgi:hypothetical protein
MAFLLGRKLSMFFCMRKEMRKNNDVKDTETGRVSGKLDVKNSTKPFFDAFISTRNKSKFLRIENDRPCKTSNKRLTRKYSIEDL